MKALDELTLYVEVANDRKSIQQLQSLLMKMNGLERALVDTDDGEVKITYNQQQLSQEEIVNSIKNNGFNLLP